MENNINDCQFSKNELQELAKQYAGKLLLREEITLPKKVFLQAIHENLWLEAPPFSKKFFISQCQRCGNKSRPLLGTIPCYTCNNPHLYCRKCIEMGRVMECTPLYEWNGPVPQWRKHLSPCTWNGELTTHQQQAATRIVQAIRKREKEILIWAVCGSGKTEMLFPGITEALQQGKRVCIATPRADVVRELKPRLEQAFANVSIQALFGGSEENEGSAQLILSTTHQLLRFKEAFDLLIIDEIDAFPFHADSSLPFAANRAKKKINTTIYLTATPRKKHQVQIRQKKLPHAFVPVRFHGHPLPVPKMKMTLTLKKDLKHNKPPSTFIQWIKKRQNISRQLLIFVPTISLAEKLLDSVGEILVQEKVLESNEKLAFVHAEDPKRAEKVQLFRQKQLTVLVTTTILERGVTFPSVDVAIFNSGHDVFDEAALVQIAGRAGRSADDPSGEIIFFHDGKTDAMEQAITLIRQMNRRAGFKD